jgi:hypothetical protein
MDPRRGRGIRRGAGIGALAGIGLAVLYVALGLRVHEVTELLGYSLVVVGFPAIFAAIPVVHASGLRGGLGEYAALVCLTFPLNGMLWGAILGGVLGTPTAADDHGD